MEGTTEDPTGGRSKGDWEGTTSVQVQRKVHARTALNEVDVESSVRADGDDGEDEETDEAGRASSSRSDTRLWGSRDEGGLEIAGAHGSYYHFLIH
jgi:hypothetical protein